jgi:hypothetical protein
MRRTALVMLVAMVALAAGCSCSNEPTAVLGSPTPASGVVEDAHPGKLVIAFTRFMDTNVVTDVEFAKKLNSTPLEGYTALLTKHAYGQFYVLVKEGLYEDEMAKLKTGKLIRVYGRVAAHRLPTDESPKVSLVVDE